MALQLLPLLLVLRRLQLVVVLPSSAAASALFRQATDRLQLRQTSSAIIHMSSQRSITSFFSKKPPDSSDSAPAAKTNGPPKSPLRPIGNELLPIAAGNEDDSPVKTGRRSRRKRLISSSSSESSEAPATLAPPPRVLDDDDDDDEGKDRHQDEDGTKKEKKTKKKTPAKSKPSVKKVTSPKASPKPKKQKVSQNKCEKQKSSSEGGSNKKEEDQKSSEEDPDVSGRRSDGDEPMMKKKESPSKSKSLFSNPNDCGNVPDYCEVVKKSSYHPISSAIWKRKDKTPYLAFAKTLEAIEVTSSRLKMVEILSNYFRSLIVLSPDDLLPSVYMCLNRIAPAYEGKELGIGDMVLMKAIAQSTGRSLQQIRADVSKRGDLGLVAEFSRGTQKIMFRPAALTVSGVFSKLKEISGLTGHACMNKKTEKIQAMLVACRQSEARFLIRSLAGKMRIGLAEQSVLQALAQACVMTPPAQQDYPPKVLTAFKDTTADKFKEALERSALLLKTAYCECPCYDKLIPVLLSEGMEAVADKCKITPGIPLKPMLAHPTKGISEVLSRFDNVSFTCEWKYDGERAQIHLLPDGRYGIYSRNQEDNTSKYPDIIERFGKCLVHQDDKAMVSSCILDCEAVAWDRETKQIQPFQVLSTRKRKDAADSDIKVQVAVYAFDLLYLNGEPLVREPLRKRRQLLRQHFQEVQGEFHFAKCGDPDNMDDVQALLEESVKENCEGLMVKALDVEATYEIAKRSRNWLKLKKDYMDGVGDTIDVVVMGGYLGKGKRTGTYGGFLLGIYDPDNEQYQTICKIGTGFSDEDLSTHYAFFQQHRIDKPRAYYAFDASLQPDHWFDLAQVWEIKAADLSLSPVHQAAMGIVEPSRGISLRFPRFVRIREDKQPEDVTSAQQIADMYNSQEQVKNKNKAMQKNKDQDDFDF